MRLRLAGDFLRDDRHVLRADTGIQGRWVFDNLDVRNPDPQGLRGADKKLSQDRAVALSAERTKACGRACPVGELNRAERNLSHLCKMDGRDCDCDVGAGAAFFYCREIADNPATMPLRLSLYTLVLCLPSSPGGDAPWPRSKTLHASSF